MEERVTEGRQQNEGLDGTDGAGTGETEQLVTGSPAQGDASTTAALADSGQGTSTCGDKPKEKRSKEYLIS